MVSRLPTGYIRTVHAPIAQRPPPGRASPTTLILLAFLMMPAVAWATTTQARPAYLDQPSRVVLPVGYSARRSYPVFIPLPPTGMSSLLMARSLGLDPERQTQFILLLPPGRPQRTEYLPDRVDRLERGDHAPLHVEGTAPVESIANDRAPERVPAPQVSRTDGHDIDVARECEGTSAAVALEPRLNVRPG